MDTQTLLRGFINKQISSSTKRNYELVINRFLNWTNTRYKKQDPDNFLNWTNGQFKEGNLWVTEYQNHLKGLTNKAGAPLENRTVNYHVVIVGKFYKEATGRRLVYDRLKEKPTDVQFLTAGELKKLLDSSEGVWKAMIGFFADSGVRVSELSNISKQRFTNCVPVEYEILGKGLKKRLVIISEPTLKLLEATYKDGLIFGQSFSIRQIQRELSKIGKTAGLNKKLHPHMLRHTMATTMLGRGVDIRNIQNMLGHSFLNTTQIYTHVVPEKLREVWKQSFERG